MLYIGNIETLIENKPNIRSLIGEFKIPEGHLGYFEKDNLKHEIIFEPYDISGDFIFGILEIEIEGKHWDNDILYRWPLMCSDTSFNYKDLPSYCIPYTILVHHLRGYGCSMAISNNDTIKLYFIASKIISKEYSILTITLDIKEVKLIQ